MGRIAKLWKGRLIFFCPGCRDRQQVPVTGPQAWSWNGDLEKPTLSPSLLLRHDLPDEAFVCHSFIRDGKIQFLNDCTHDLRGQTVDIPDLSTPGKYDEGYEP